MELLFIAGMRGWQLILIIVIGFLLFGGVKKIPEIMRSLGKGMHSFRQGIEDAKAEMNKPIEKYDPEKEKEKPTEDAEEPKSE